VSTLRAGSIPLQPTRLHDALRYGLALAALLAVLALRLTSKSVLAHESDFFLFPLTVFLVAWRLGLGPGLFATAAAAAAVWLFLLDPRIPLGQRVAHTAVFLCQAGLTSAVAWYLSRLHSARLLADRRADSFLDKVDDGFFTVDADWRFTYFNRYFRQNAPGPVEDLVGRNLWTTYREFLGTDHEERFRQVMATRASLHFEAKSLISERWFRIYAYPFEDGIAVFSTDISDRRNAEEEMRKAKEEAERRTRQALEARAQAEAASRMKDQFLATLSHELRTPLNAILGWVQILRSGKMDAAGARRGLETIERSSRAQAQLIDDLLDVSRIISGKLRLELRPVDLPEIIDAAMATVAPAAEAKGIQLDKVYAPLASPLSGDPERLQQVVWNLLSNAVKFSQRGGRVEVRLSPGEDAHAEIRIADNGQGIDPELLPFVFDPFWQADSSTTRRQGGLGLGLSIVRQMVEMHGGTVRVESAGAGQGSTFTVALPFVAGAVPRAALPRELPAVSLRGLRLLVVDDDADTRDLLWQILTDSGAQVATAASAAEALAALESAPPHVLVSDIGMPGRDGFELIRDVRSRWSAEDLPAIALTAFARADDRRRTREAGFQAHLTKPFDAADLAATVARLAAPL
jgi:signal transduction histidine kinase